MKRNNYLWLGLIIIISGCSGIIKEDTNLEISKNQIAQKNIINESQEESNLDKVKLLRVIDGDTIEVSLEDGIKEIVRIIGIDTPEILYGETASDCFAQEARERMEELLFNGYISLEKNNVGEDRDKYERLLRFVSVNEEDVGSILIKEGYARAYPWFMHSKKENYKILEDVAKKRGRGIWGECSE